MTIARLHGEVIAESSETVVIAGRHYFPPKSVRSGYFRPVRTEDAEHVYTVTVHGSATECARTEADAPDPRVAGHIVFDTPVVIEDS